MIHVLEHIQHDREALSHLGRMLRPGGKLLIEVPALPLLFSVHDEALGHFRRYNKKNLRMAIDENIFTIRKLYYQDPIGAMGSFVFFKLKKIKLKSESGIELVKKQGLFFDRFVIPFEAFIEKVVTFPFGLSLTAVLEIK